MLLTHDEFNDEVDAFVGDVADAANCFPSVWTIDVTVASPEADRLRSVVDAVLPLRGPEDGDDGGLTGHSGRAFFCL